MKLICSLLLAATLAYIPAHSQNETLLVQKIKAKLEKVRDYQANGKMKIDVAFINAPESNVVIFYKNPDKFKVKKEGGISILPKGGVSVNITSLLLDNEYTVVPAVNSTINGVATKVVKLLPHDEKSDIVITTLYLDEKELLIRKASVTTRENGTYDVELDFGKYKSWGLPDKVVFLFNTKDYKLPKGLTLEYEKSGKKTESANKSSKGRVEISYSSYVINKGIDDKVFAD